MAVQTKKIFAQKISGSLIIGFVLAYEIKQRANKFPTQKRP
jgi:hypothetical protein